MVWGTYGARRHSDHALPATIDVPPPHMIQCANCESSFVLLPGQELPPSWKVIDGEPLCGDCAPPRKGALRAAIREGECDRPTGPTGRSHPHQSVGPDERSRFRGCRVGHEIVLGFVAIQIRAGAKAPPGRDEAVQFMVDRHEIDELIIHLSAIRAELVASQTPGAAAREGAVSMASRAIESGGVIVETRPAAGTRPRAWRSRAAGAPASTPPAKSRGRI